MAIFSSEAREAARRERALVAGCRRHDVPAFEQLYKDHSGRLYNLVYRMTGNAGDADDLLQEIFLQVYRRIDSFRGDSSLGTWLFRLATNHCLDHLRSKQGRQQRATASIDEMEGFEPVAHASWRPDAALDRVDLERAVAQLPPSYRAAFVLHDIEGFDHAEVGRHLGIAEGTSKSLLHKARLRLRVLLRGLDDADGCEPSEALADAAGRHAARGTS
jgi:RNA polymerase sigma-70 factor (ECF subfamily)